MDLNVAIKGIEKTLRGVERVQVHKTRSINTAFRVEGYRLKNLLQKQLREGAPGGDSFDDLSILARRWWRRSRKNNPLNQLAKGIRYHVPNTRVPTLQVGFVGPINQRERASMVLSGLRLSSKGGYRGIAAGAMTSKSWRRLGYKLQKGFERRITDEQRASLFRKANAMRKNNPNRKVFILKPETTKFKTPPRPIIDPFWSQQRNRSVENIKSNFRKKMKGAKI